MSSAKRETALQIRGLEAAGCEKLRHPRRSTQNHANVNTINARLEDLALVNARSRSWRGAVGKAPKATQDNAKALGTRVSTAGEQAVLDKAARIKDKRRQQPPTDPG